MLWTTLLLLLSMGAWIIHQTRPARLAAHVTLVLEQATGAAAHIDKAYLSSTGEIELENISLQLPDRPGEAGRLFEAERVIIRPDFLALMTGQINARSLRFIRPVVYLTEEVDRGRFNIQALAPASPRRREDAARRAAPQRLPSVFVRHAMIRFGEVVGDEYRALGSLSLEGNLGETRSQTGTYYFALRQQNDAAAPGPTVAGRFSLIDRFFDIHLEDFSFDQPQGNFLPRSVREFWKSLDPRGTIPEVTFYYDAQQGRQIRLQLQDGELTLPVGDAPPRMTDVDATFDMVGDRLEITQLTGQIKGVRFHIGGWFDGLGADDPFHITAATEPFELPDDPQYLFGLPPVVHKYYDRYQPAGRFRADAVVSRDVKDGPIQYAGAVDLIDVSVRYFRFPYPTHSARGRVVFNADAVTLDNLRAIGPNGARLTLNGTISPPNDDAVVDLTITAEGVHLDDALLAAMEPKHRDIYRRFFDEPAYQRWVERGLIRASDEAPGDAPVHALGGVVDIVTRIERGYGRTLPFRVTSTVTPREASLFFGFWHYPIRVTDGSVVIGPDRIEIRQAVFDTPGGGGGMLDGAVLRPPGQPIEPDLTLTRVRLPIDELLLASVPEPQGRWTRAMHMTGDILADGRILQGSDGQLDWNVRATLENASTDPFASGYALTDVAGSAVLTRRDVTLNRITGHRGGGRLSVDGRIAWGDDDAGLDLAFDGRAVPIEPSVAGLTPADTEPRRRLDRLFADYAPTGVTDAKLRLIGVGDAPMNFQLTLEPDTLDVTHHGQRIQLRDMTGAADIQPDMIEIRGLGGRFGEGAFTAYGNVYPQQGGRMSLNFTAHSPRLDPATRAVLPQPVLRVIDELDVDGGYAITAGRFATNPLAVQGPTSEFQADIVLNNASADLGVDMTQLDGQLGVHVINFKDADWPFIDLRLHADRVKAKDRLITPLSVELVTGDHPDTLDLRRCRGAMYGGQVLADGQVQLGEHGGYSIDLRLVDVDVDAFRYPKKTNAALAAARSADPDGPAPVEFRSGSLSANFVLDQLYADPASRRGRGAMRVRDANLYDDPLPLALIEAINLRLPTTSRFDRAGAKFLIHGDTVLFDEIWIESPTTAITGGGDMNWDSQRLNLTMYTRNNANWDLGPVSDMFNVFKDELVSVQVSGTLEDPQTRVRSFSGIARFWSGLTGANASDSPAPEPINPRRTTR